MYSGDIQLGDTIDIKFTTRQFTTGAPFLLAGSPVVSAYVGNNTTEITSGITLSANFDSVTGLNNVRVVASGGNGFAAQTNISLVITTPPQKKGRGSSFERGTPALLLVPNRHQTVINVSNVRRLPRKK